MRMGEVIGERLQLRWNGQKGPERYELAAPDERRVALLSLNGPEELARMECAEGTWRVHKRSRHGWDMIIESTAGRQVGSYASRRWLPGGTIALRSGTQLDLKRPLPGVWKLQKTDTTERIVDIRGHRSASAALTIHSQAGLVTDAHVAILAACAVVMLERTLRVSIGGAV